MQKIEGNDFIVKDRVGPEENNKLIVYPLVSQLLFSIC